MSRPLTRVATLIVTATLALGACDSGEEPQPASTAPRATTTTGGVATTTSPEPNPAAAISEAVAAAAQALLEQPSVQAIHLEYDEEDVLTKTAWIDWRASGDFLLVAASQMEIGAVAQVAESLQTAARSDLRSEPWAGEEPPLPTADIGLLLAFDLAGLARGTIADEVADVPSAAIEVANEVGDDGATRWTMRLPFGEATAIREWTIDGDGVLRSYSLSSDSAGPLFGAFAVAEFRFNPVLDAEPITLPQVGTELEVAAILPPDVPLPGP